MDEGTKDFVKIEKAHLKGWAFCLVKFFASAERIKVRLTARELQKKFCVTEEFNCLNFIRKSVKFGKRKGAGVS